MVKSKTSMSGSGRSRGGNGGDNGGDNGGITSSAQAANFDELKAYAASKGIDVRDTLRNYNLEAVKEAVDGVDDVLALFPEIAGNEKVFIDGDTRREGTIAFAQRNGGVWLNSRWWKGDGSMSKLQDAADRSYDQKFHPSNEIKNFSSHEMGHVINSIIIDNAVTDNGTSYWSWYEAASDWNKSTTATKIVGEAARAVKKTPYGKGKTNAELVAAISGYASYNRAEAFAEAVADYTAHGANANPMSVEIYRIIKGRLA